jgi:hypothetical protein
MAAAGKAYQDRNFAEPETLYANALKQAEAFGPSDPRQLTARRARGIPSNS